MVVVVVKSNKAVGEEACQLSLLKILPPWVGRKEKCRCIETRPKKKNQSQKKIGKNSGKIWGSGQCFLKLAVYQNHLQFLLKMQIPKFYSRSEVGSCNLYFIITSSPGILPHGKLVWSKAKSTNLTSASNYHTSCHPLSTIAQTSLLPFDTATGLLSTEKVCLCCYWVSLFRVNTTLHHVVAAKHIKLCLIFYTNRHIYELSKSKTYLKNLMNEQS